MPSGPGPGLPDPDHRARLPGARERGGPPHVQRHHGDPRQHAAPLQHPPLRGRPPGRAPARGRGPRHAHGRRLRRQGRHRRHRLRPGGPRRQAHGPAREDDLRARVVHPRVLQAPPLPRPLPDGLQQGRAHQGLPHPHPRRRRRLLLRDALGDLALHGAVLRPLRRGERPLRHLRRLHEQRVLRRHARLRQPADELHRRAAGGDGRRAGWAWIPSSSGGRTW